MNCNQKKQISGSFLREPMTIHSNEQTISSFCHLKSISLGAREEVYKEIKRASGLDGRGKVSDRTIEG